MKTIGHTLTNGLKLLVIPTPTTEIVAIRVYWPGGSVWETPTTQGLAHWLSAVLTKGARDLTSQDIALKVEAAGASLSCDVQADFAIVNLSCLKGDLPTLLPLLAAILREPTFDESELDLERRSTLQAIRAQQERPFTLAYAQLRKQFYGDHPYGFAELGTAELLSTLTRQDVLNYYHQTCAPHHMVIAMAGNLDLETVLPLVERYWGDWQTNQTLPPLPTAVPQPITRTTITQETQQSTILLGYAAAPLCHPDHIPLKLLSTYLGSGLSSRLFVELREKKGLAYEVSAFYPGRLGASHFVTYIGTAPHNLAVAESGLREEVQRLVTTRLSSDALRVSQNKLLGQYALGKQSNAQLARILGLYEVLGLGADYDDRYPDHIKDVTAEHLQTVAETYFSAPTVTVIGPQSDTLI